MVKIDRHVKSRGILRPVIELAAPHTWPAAVMPVLMAIACAAARGAPLRPWVGVLTLGVSVLLQSAVNTLNDYRDFKKGLDTPDNCTDPTDAALIYTSISPRGALAVGLSFLLAAALLGAYLTALCGASLLWYAAAAAGAIALYVLPGISFSELPLGELLSGAAMGLVLPCAAWHAQTGSFSWQAVPVFLPSFLTIACIMLTNNTSDIEKDRESSRRTLPVCIGRKAATILLRCVLVGSAVLVGVQTLLSFPGGAAALVPMAAGLAISPRTRAIFAGPVNAQRRRENMGSVLSWCVWVCAGFTACMTLSALII